MTWNHESFARLSSLLLLPALALATSTASAAVGDAPFILSPIADGFVRDGDLGNNANPPFDGVGDKVYSPNNTVQILHAVDLTGSTDGEDRGLYEFNIASLPGASQAELVLRRYHSMGPYPLGFDIFVYEADGQITLNDFVAGTYFSSFSYSGETTVTLDVTQAVQDAINNGVDKIGFNLRRSSPNPAVINGPFAAFGSNQVGTPAKLQGVVPEPSSLALFGGLASLSILRRRQR